MNTTPKALLLRCYAEKKDGQWQAFCLDLCLATQASSYKAVQQKLEDMIIEYVYDAVAGEDKEHAGQLLTRKAPAYYWAKYYTYVFLCRIGLLGNKVRKLFSEPWPLVLAGHQH